MSTSHDHSKPPCFSDRDTILVSINLVISQPAVFSKQNCNYDILLVKNLV